MALMLSGVDDQGADDAADAGLNVRFVRHGLLQDLIQLSQRVTHAGQKKAVLIAEILIEDAHGNAGGLGDGIDIGTIQTESGKLVDAGLQDQVHGFFIELFIHSPSPSVRVVSGDSQDRHSIYPRRHICQ